MYTNGIVDRTDWNYSYTHTTTKYTVRNFGSKKLYSSSQMRAIKETNDGVSAVVDEIHDAELMQKLEYVITTRCW